MVVQEGVDAQTSLHAGRDGRLYLFTDRDAPRGRLMVTGPGALDYASWQELLPSDREAVLGGYAILDGAELGRPVLLAAWTRHAISEITVHDLATGELRGPDRPAARPAAPSAGCTSAPRAGTRPGSPTPTTPRRPRSTTTTRGTARSAWPSGRPGTVAVPAVTTRQIAYQSKDGTTVRMVVIAGAAGQPGGPRPAILYGYGGFNISR